MTWATSMTLLASVTALLLSIGACVVAALSLHLYRSTSSARLSARLTALESMCEALSAECKAIRMARNMAAHRARKSAEETSTANPADPEAARAATLRSLAPLVGRTNAK